MASLDTRISKLSQEVDERYRRELRLALQDIRHRRDFDVVKMRMNPLALRLIDDVYRNAGFDGRPSDNLFACLEHASGTVSSKGPINRLIPDEVATCLHFTRIFAAKVNHDLTRIMPS